MCLTNTNRMVEVLLDGARFGPDSVPSNMTVIGGGHLRGLCSTTTWWSHLNSIDAIELPSRLPRS